jgi:hypothetical protein
MTAEWRAARDIAKNEPPIAIDTYQRDGPLNNNQKHLNIQSDPLRPIWSMSLMKDPAPARARNTS